MAGDLLTLACLDVGSTFTKAVLVGEDDGAVLGRASRPTTTPATTGGDVLDGVRAALADLAGTGAPVPTLSDPDRVLICSSAGGGLRLAVVGYERPVTAEAGHRVGLSAGARVVHVAAGPLRREDVTALRAARADVVLLVGGTDGGNAEVLVHNARALARARVGAPVVVAGNAGAAGEVATELAATGRRYRVTANVLPRIGELSPAPAREAIRDVFLEHVIGGKRLSRGPAFASLVRAPTPDAVLAGVARLAEARGEDVLLVDVGGATTDVYSVLTPEGEDAAIRRDVVGTLWHARTVEGDLGMRWNAAGSWEAGVAEGLLDRDDEPLRQWVAACRDDSGRLPRDPGEAALDLRLAAAAARVAIRRHGRPAAPGDRPRPLADVALLVGSGGVLRHAAPDRAHTLLAEAAADHGAGWRPPDRAEVTVDGSYLTFAAGLLAAEHPRLAGAVAAQAAAPRRPLHSGAGRPPGEGPARARGPVPGGLSRRTASPRGS